MEKFQTDWLYHQLENAEKVLQDLRNGKQIVVDGDDVTAQWVTICERLIPQLQRVIEQYEMRNKHHQLTL